MKENTIDQAFSQYRMILQHRDDKLSVIELRILTYILQKSLRGHVFQLQQMLSNDNNVKPILDQLNTAASMISHRIGIDQEHYSHDDHEDIIIYYNTLWNQNNLSAITILEGLVDSIRSIITSLYIGIELIRNSITKDAEVPYNLLINDINTLKAVRELTVEYLHP